MAEWSEKKVASAAAAAAAATAPSRGTDRVHDVDSDDGNIVTNRHHHDGGDASRSDSVSSVRRHRRRHHRGRSKEDKHRRKRKRSKRSRSESRRRNEYEYDDDEYDDDDDGARSDASSIQERSRKRKSHKKKAHKRRRRKRTSTSSDESSDAQSTSSSSATSSNSSGSSSKSRSRSRKKHRRNDEAKPATKERRKKKEKHSRHRDEKKDSTRRSDAEAKPRGKPSSLSSSDLPQFGAHGVLRSSDMPKVQRSFSAWLAEVKGITHGTSKGELHKLFEDYREDYNTATLPHAKYYDYDKWEMDEHIRKQKSAPAPSTANDDEALHRAEMRKRAAAKEKAEQEALLATMDRSKIQDMKRQADLRAQMQHAFRVGDKDTYRRLKDKLEPDPV